MKNNDIPFYLLIACLIFFIIGVLSFVTLSIENKINNIKKECDSYKSSGFETIYEQPSNFLDFGNCKVKIDGRLMDLIEVDKYLDIQNKINNLKK